MKDDEQVDGKKNLCIFSPQGHTKSSSILHRIQHFYSKKTPRERLNLHTFHTLHTSFQQDFLKILKFQRGMAEHYYKKSSYEKMTFFGEVVHITVVFESQAALLILCLAVKTYPDLNDEQQQKLKIWVKYNLIVIILLEKELFIRRFSSPFYCTHGNSN